MKILAATQSYYGERIVENIRKHGPADWQVEAIALPAVLPPIIDDPAEFLPATIPAADLLLAMVETPGAAQLIPDIVRLSGAKGVIAPIDKSQWIPEGLKNQIKRELAAVGVESVFPKTFCTLTEETYGFRRAAVAYSNKYIAAFAAHFGKPKLKVDVDPATRTITRAEVIRDAPCGSTRFVAQKLVGMNVEDVIPKAGLICHHYPCLASMEKEQIDDRLYDTLMHVSGYVVNEDIEEQIKPFKRPPTYVQPSGS